LTDQNRYLNAEEARQVREFVDQHSANPPADADPILDDLDRILLTSEPMNTIETTNALLTTRALESQQRGQRSSVPDKVLQAVQNDQAFADLDDVLWAGVREQAPLSEDGGWSHLDKVAAEIKAGHKARQQDEARAAKEGAATSRRFMGTGFSQERSVSAEEFERRRRG
jgi:hypothetical protein